MHKRSKILLFFWYDGVITKPIICGSPVGCPYPPGSHHMTYVVMSVPTLEKLGTHNKKREKKRKKKGIDKINLSVFVALSYEVTF